MYIYNYVRKMLHRNSQKFFVKVAVIGKNVIFHAVF